MHDDDLGVRLLPSISAQSPTDEWPAHVIDRLAVGQHVVLPRTQIVERLVGGVNHGDDDSAG